MSYTPTRQTQSLIPRDAQMYSDRIAVVRYIFLFFNIALVAIGIGILCLCMWLRFEPGLGEWIDDLKLQPFYIGLYLLIICALIMTFGCVLGCFSIYTENVILIYVFVGLSIVGFVFGVAGSATTLEHSTQFSAIQPMIRESMRRLIMNAHDEQSKKILATIQETIACCGANGPTDYTSLRQPLPNQCRDTVTGNPFFHGCVDELTWFFEEKTFWIAGLTMTGCLMQILNIVTSLIMILALHKEEVYMGRMSNN